MKDKDLEKAVKDLMIVFLPDLKIFVDEWIATHTLVIECALKHTHKGELSGHRER